MFLWTFFRQRNMHDSPNNHHNAWKEKIFVMCLCHSSNKTEKPEIKNRCIDRHAHTQTLSIHTQWTFKESVYLTVVLITLYLYFILICYSLEKNIIFENWKRKKNNIMKMVKSVDCECPHNYCVFLLFRILSLNEIKN